MNWGNKDKTRETLSSGYSWTRFILIPVILGAVSQIIYEPEGRAWGFAYFSLSMGLYALLSRLRKLKFDDQNIYFIRSKKETVIPIKTIVSIKRSRSKVNGERFWKLTYTNAKGKETTIRYFRSMFNKDFHEKVRMANPDVVIWTHPHFNH